MGKKKKRALGNIALSQGPRLWPADNEERGHQCNPGLKTEVVRLEARYPVLTSGCRGCCRQGCGAPSDLRTDRPDAGGGSKQTWLVASGN